MVDQFRVVLTWGRAAGPWQARSRGGGEHARGKAVAELRGAPVGNPSTHLLLGRKGQGIWKTEEIHPNEPACRVNNAQMMTMLAHMPPTTLTLDRAPIPGSLVIVLMAPCYRQYRPPDNCELEATVRN